jgi:hypothetical protein
MDTRALLIELLISGFFAVACFRARAASPDMSGVTPYVLFGLTDRLERLHRSRWQWCSIVILLVIVRMQRGTPLVAEVTALIQFIIFLALPTLKFAEKEALRKA